MKLKMRKNLNNLERAKKRDHKIMITDEAINKVPRVQYKEIPETEYDNLRNWQDKFCKFLRMKMIPMKWQ